jgi:hygromycin-B 7''-O-kinase
MTLPDLRDPRAFDALHDDTPRWQALLQDVVTRLDLAGPLQPLTDGTVLVAALGDAQVFKLFPPFLRDHWAFERGMLGRLQGRLAVPTPALLGSGELDGWGWLLMSRLAGRPLRDAWPHLTEPQREGLLRQIGALAAELHRLPVGDQAALAPAWADFLARQRAGCRARQQRTGLPAPLLEGLEDFIAGPVPQGPDVLLTGEFTPMNLFVDASGEHLAGMFDFGDGLVGPVAYDWGGPLCFLAAGHAGRVAAFFAGYGQGFDAAQRETQLRLLLLHRYSHLPIQLASCPGWEQAASLPELARRLWP